MSKAKMSWTKCRGGTAVVGLLLLFSLFLVGCGEPAEVATELPTSEAAPTEIAAAPATSTTAPTEPPTPTTAPTEPPPTEAPTEAPPTATPTEEPTPEPVDDSGCITCHTNDETLQALATEEEEGESLSEGEG